MIAHYYVTMSVAALVDRRALWSSTGGAQVEPSPVSCRPGGSSRRWNLRGGLSPQVAQVAQVARPEPSPVIFWTRPVASLVLPGCRLNRRRCRQDVQELRRGCHPAETG